MSVFALGIAGATGAPYAMRALQALVDRGHDVHAVISDAGRRVLEVELGERLPGDMDGDVARLMALAGADGPGKLRVYGINDYAAPIASGSFHTDGMVIVPCSMGTLARVSNGTSGTLLERAADVTLKERRKLILVPREMPLSLIHLRNMVSVTEAGAEIIPPAPGFYHKPVSIQDMVDSVVGRILDRLGVEAPFFSRWKGVEGTE